MIEYYLLTRKCRVFLFKKHNLISGYQFLTKLHPNIRIYVRQVSSHSEFNNNSVENCYIISVQLYTNSIKKRIF